MSEASNFNEIPDLEPLSDRIYALMEDLIPWSMVEVQAAFPTETYWPLYRAWQQLETSNRIKFYRTKGKRKYYQKASLNLLPHIRMPDGRSLPISSFVDNIAAIIALKPNYSWELLDRNHVNKIPLLIGQLFAIAKEDVFDKEQWLAIRKELITARGALVTVIDWIDSILNHPAMSGDPVKFKTVMASKDAPALDSLHKFLIFVRKLTTNADA